MTFTVAFVWYGGYFMHLKITKLHLIVLIKEFSWNIRSSKLFMNATILKITNFDSFKLHAGKFFNVSAVLFAARRDVKRISMPNNFIGI